jgi:hypothetical protein
MNKQKVEIVPKYVSDIADFISQYKDKKSIIIGGRRCGRIFAGRIANATNVNSEIKPKD